MQNCTTGDVFFEVLYGIPVPRVPSGNVVGLTVCASLAHILREFVSGRTEDCSGTGQPRSLGPGLRALLSSSLKGSVKLSHPWSHGTYVRRSVKQSQFQTFYPPALISSHSF